MKIDKEKMAEKMKAKMKDKSSKEMDEKESKSEKMMNQKEEKMRMADDLTDDEIDMMTNKMMFNNKIR
jgi:hypothetical protein